MERKKFNWNVSLSDDRGTVTKRVVSAFWDPEQLGCTEAVGLAGKCAAWLASSKQREYFVVKVEQIA